MNLTRLSSRFIVRMMLVRMNAQAMLRQAAT